MANHTAEGIDEFRQLLVKLERHASELERSRIERVLASQYAVTRGLAESSSVEEAAPRVLESICIIGGWHLGELWVVNIPKNQLLWQGCWHDPKLNASRFIAESRKIRSVEGASLPGRVIESRKQIWITDLEADRNFTRRDVAAGLGLSSAVGCPLKAQGKIVGIMNFFSTKIRRPDREVPELLEMLGNQVGEFIMRSHVSLELQESERRFRALIENSHDAVSLLDLEGKIVYISPSAERIFGYSFDEFVGRSAFGFIHPQDREHTTHLMRKLILQPGASVRTEYRFRKKDGSWIWMEGVGTNLLHEPSVQAIVTNSRDITERKAAEVALRESRSQMVGVITSAMDAIITVDEEQKVMIFNNSAEKMFGYSAAEVFGQPLDRFIPERFRAGHRQHIKTFGQTSVTKRSMGELGTIFGLRSNGEEFPIEASISHLEVGGRKLFTVILRDVSEKQQAQEEIAKARNRLVAIVESSDDAIIGKTLDGIVLSWNAGAEKTFGYTADEMIGQSIKRLVPPELAHEEELILERVGRGEHVGHYEVTRIKKDGTRIDVWLSVSPLLDHDETVIGSSSISRDISLRKRAERREKFLFDAGRALEEEPLDYKMRLKKVAELAVPAVADWCAVDIVEDNGVFSRVAVTHSDPAKVELAYELQKKYPLDPEAPSGIYKIITSGGTAFYPVIEDAFLQSVTQNEEHLRMMRELGLKSVIVVPLIARQETVGAITLVMADSKRVYTKDDVTLAVDLARRAAAAIDNARLYFEVTLSNQQLERRVRERTERLEAANKELEMFSYSVSHDLRTPLRAIQGFSEILQGGHSETLDGEGKRLLAVIQKNVHKMGQLINDLLSFSRLSREGLERASIDMTALVYSVVEELRLSQPKRLISVSLTDLPPLIGDHAMMRQVLINLISNALKFTRDVGEARIEIGGVKDAGQLTYYVKDNGVGFDMKHADKLFGVFQRLHKHDEFEGTGVGLAIVQRIVHRHGGKVWAEAELGRGATFFFTIPDRSNL